MTDKENDIDGNKDLTPFASPEDDRDGLDLLCDLVTKDTTNQADENSADNVPSAHFKGDEPYYEILKALREARGQSIQELAHCTRISANFIEALEKGDTAALPGEVFARGFLRSLAKALEADEKMIMERYHAHGDVKPEAKPQSSLFNRNTKPGSEDEPTRPIQSGAEGGSKDLYLANPHHPARNTIRLAAMLVLLIAASVAGVMVLKEQLNSDPSSKTSEQAAKPTPSKVVPPVTQEVAKQELPTVAETFEVPVVEPAPAVEDLPKPKEEVVVQEKKQYLDLTVLSEVTVSMSLDGAIKKEEVLLPDTYRFQFDENAELNLKDAGAVRVKYNGNDLGVLGRSGQPKKLAFTQKITNTL